MKRILAMILIATPLMAVAVDHGNGVGNGGDICENRFKTVRDDLNTWILNGGSAGLTLPAGISFGQYNQSMLQQIHNAKISCVEDVIFVGQAEKTCKNFVAEDGTVLINCNADRFMKTAESDQYVLVHHEYAGLAGFEVNQGESSDYQLSNQITGFLGDFLVKKLVIKAPDSPAPANPACTIETMRPLIEDGIKKYLSKVVSSRYIAVDESSVQISYRGLLDYKDFDFAGGTMKEYGFDITFKSAKGTEFKIITATSDWPLPPAPPLYPVFSVPQAFVEKMYDAEGNFTGERCVVNSHRGYNRNSYFINISSGKTVNEDLISASYGILASKVLEK
jgi:hypothetical protein